MIKTHMTRNEFYEYVKTNLESIDMDELSIELYYKIVFNLAIYIMDDISKKRDLPADLLRKLQDMGNNLSKLGMTRKLRESRKLINGFVDLT